MRDLFHEETYEGFTIRFYRLDEDMSPRGQFQNEDGSDDEETLERIASGFYDWFCVECTASKAGVELGSDYLGGCCYESVSDFLTPDGCADGMRSEAVRCARETLANLCAS